MDEPSSSPSAYTEQNIAPSHSPHFRTLSAIAYVVAFWIGFRVVHFLFVLFSNVPSGGAALLVSLATGVGFAWLSGHFFRWSTRGTARAHAFTKRWFTITFSLLATIFAVLLCFSFVPTVLGLFYPDSPAPQVSNLLLHPLSIPANENGIYNLMQGAQSLTPIASSTKPATIEKLVNGSNWNNALAAKILTGNAAALQDFASASQKAYIQNPALEKPRVYTFASSTLLNYDGIRQLALLNVLSAYAQAKAGHSDAALSQALQGVRVSALINRGQPAPIDWLVSQELRNTGLAALGRIATTTQPTAQALSAAAQNLTPYRTVSGAQNSIKAQFMSQYHNVTTQASSTTDLVYFQPNKTISYFAANARADIAAVTAPCATATSSLLAVAYPHSVLAMYFTPNAIGKLLYKVEGANFGNGFKAEMCKTEVHTGLTQLLLALKAYELTHNGTLPATLNALVPTYLHTLPTDPFSGKSFEYNPHARTISSVGRNVAGLGPQWQGLAHPTFHI